MMSIVKLSWACPLLLLCSCMPMHPHPPLFMGPPTLGRQLIDLKEAHDRGALSDREYSDVKAKELELVEHHGDSLSHGSAPHECEYAKKQLAGDAPTHEKSCACKMRHSKSAKK